MRGKKQRKLSQLLRFFSKFACIRGQHVIAPRPYGEGLLNYVYGSRNNWDENMGDKTIIGIFGTLSTPAKQKTKQLSQMTANLFWLPLLR